MRYSFAIQSHISGEGTNSPHLLRYRPHTSTIEVPGAAAASGAVLFLLCLGGGCGCVSCSCSCSWCSAIVVDPSMFSWADEERASHPSNEGAAWPRLCLASCLLPPASPLLTRECAKCNVGPHNKPGLLTYRSGSQKPGSELLAFALRSSQSSIRERDRDRGGWLVQFSAPAHATLAILYCIVLYIPRQDFSDASRQCAWSLVWKHIPTMPD
jgi:hypothetical protein